MFNLSIQPPKRYPDIFWESQVQKPPVPQGTVLGLIPITRPGLLRCWFQCWCAQQRPPTGNFLIVLVVLDASNNPLSSKGLTAPNYSNPTEWGDGSERWLHTNVAIGNQLQIITEDPVDDGGNVEASLIGWYL